MLCLNLNFEKNIGIKIENTTTTIHLRKPENTIKNNEISVIRDNKKFLFLLIIVEKSIGKINITPYDALKPIVVFFAL